MTTPETAEKTTQALTTSQPADTRATDARAVIKAQLDQMTPQFKQGLPSHITPDRFQRVTMTAINNNPKLLSADRRSLFNACIRAANDGLLPDGREGALVIFKDKTGKELVQFLPMVLGLIKLIRQSGEIDSIGARIVYQREIDDGRFKFVIEDGKEKLYHDPMLWGDRGEMVLVYAYARFKDSGHIEYAPLHRKDVEKRRNSSRSSAAGPWKDWEQEMWLKTAIRAIAKRLPLSADIMEGIEREAPPTHFDELRNAAIAQLGQQPVGALDAPQDDTPPEMSSAEEDQHAASSNMIDRAIDEMRQAHMKTDDDLKGLVSMMRGKLREQATDGNLNATSAEALGSKLTTAYLERLREISTKKG